MALFPDMRLVVIIKSLKKTKQKKKRKQRESEAGNTVYMFMSEGEEVIGWVLNTGAPPIKAPFWFWQTVDSTEG